MDFSSPTRIPFKLVRKTADETVNNSTVLQNDNELKLAVLANEVWYIEAVIIATILAASDFKWHWTMPALAEFYGLGHEEFPYNNFSSYFELSATTSIEAVAAPETKVCRMQGLYIGGANGGDLQLQWAQNAAAVEDTKVLANSHIRAYKVN